MRWGNNLLIGKQVTDAHEPGTILATRICASVTVNGYLMLLNRQEDGDLIEFKKDAVPVGSISPEGIVTLEGTARILRHPEGHTRGHRRLDHR